MEEESIHTALSRALNGQYTLALTLDLETDHKYVIFSDQHKGAGDQADEFRLCKGAYETALKHYLADGHSLVLLGDVEELWEQGFGEVKKEYDSILRLEGSFPAGRYIRIWGNHDDEWMSDKSVRKHLSPYMPAGGVYEGLRLEINKAGQSLGRIFMVHGHQGSIAGDKLRGIARFFLKFYRILQRVFNIGQTTPAKDVCLRGQHDQQMYNWASKQQKLIMIAGHTHRPVWGSRTHLQKLQDELAELEKQPQSPERDRLIAEKKREIEERRKKSGDCNDVRKPRPSYFNTGCCKFADGEITGMELESGILRLVKWTKDQSTTGGTASVKKILEEERLEDVVAKL